MVAIDTNVLVRLLTNDEPDQAARARALIEAEPVHLTTTVVLEAAWVLRSAYGRTQDQVCIALEAIAGLPNIILQEPPRVAQALKWAGQGMDFADALHLAAPNSADGFRTFDKRLIKRAADLGLADVTEP